MTREALDRRWTARLGERWRRHAPLAPLTTFQVGGAAEWLAEVASEEELRDLAADTHAAGVPITMLGGGSNVLVADAGVAGVVVRVCDRSIERVDAATVRAGAGATINGLVRWMIGHGLSGLEAWAGTPGTVGGAIYGNAHWGGENIGDHVRSVRLVTVSGTVSDVPAGQMGFGYDTSRVQRTRELVLSAAFIVRPGDPAALRDRARASLHYRKATQPLALPSAGCVFQNPSETDPVPEGMPRSAGALIDRAGLKGAARGGARISERHANFIVNDGGASAEDIRVLIEEARRAVREQFGIVLRDEVVYLGTFRHG